MLSATNFDGLKLTYTYYAAAPHRVENVLESNVDGTLGKELNFTYGNNQTTFTDEKGRKNIYVFDNSGKTVNIQNNEGYASAYNYSDSANISKLSLESMLEKTQINLLQNHSGETDGVWTKGDWSSGTVTQEYTTEDKYLGNRSMKIVKTSDSGGCDFEQNGVPIEKGKVYTLSSYVKTKDIPEKDGAGAAIFVGYIDSTGTCQFIIKYINGNSDWHREEMQFTLPQDAQENTVWAACSILNTTGTAYFDCMQLEEGAMANRYNLIENPDFLYGSGVPTSWSKNGECDSSDILITTDDHTSTLNNRVFKFNGKANKLKNLLQVVNASGKKGDVFSVGSWAKGQSVPLTTGRNFAISIGFKAADGGYDWHESKFNNDSTEWQYLSNQVIANCDYTQIACYIIYYNNVNTAMFDGIQLYKEEFGTSYQYDSKGNVISSKSLAEQNSKFEYNTTNDLVTSTDPKGNQFKYEYDGKHNITKATSAENVVYSFTYDSSGNPLTSKVGDSTIFINSSAAYTSSGNYLNTITDSSGNTVSNTWDESKGTLKTTTDAKGKTTTYSYDGMDRLTNVSKSVDGDTINNGYSYENDRIRTITQNGFNYNFGYDSLGNSTTVAAGTQNLITNTYESRTSKLLESTYGNGQKVSSDYDNLDRITGRKYNGSVLYTYGYDGSGNIGYQQDFINGVNYRYIYDISNRLVKVMDSKGYNTTYEFDLNNNVSKLIEELGESKGSDIARNRPSASSSNQDTNTVSDKAFDGNSTTRWASLASDPQWIYVDLGSTKSIKRVILNWETAYGKSYDIQVSNDAVNWTTIFSTDSGDGSIDDISGLSGSGRYVRMYGKVRGTSWGYSLWNFEVYETSPKVTSYQYDKDNRPVKTILSSGGTVTNQYDTLGRLNNKIYNSTTPFNVTYNYKAGVNGSTTTKVESINNNGSTINYTYDANGNIETITENSKQIKYYYNELNEVVREDNAVLNKTIMYSYDAGGNIKTKVEYAYTTGTPVNPTNTINYTYGDTNWKDKLTAYNGKAITYDAIGNPLTYDGWTFTWEQGRQLASMSKTGTSISYKYNDQGIRTEKTLNGVTTKYHLNCSNVTYEDNGTDKIYYTYDSSSNLVSMNLNGVEYYYIRNAQGDIIGLFDKNGTQVVSYVYDSWGKLISITGSLKDTVGIKNPYRYRGYRYDTETGLYYLQSRYYNPDWGRFINADAIAGQVGELLSHNMFAYCGNNPITRKDPSGFMWRMANEDIDTRETAPIGNIEISSSPSWLSRGADIATGALQEITKSVEFEVSKSGTLGGGPLQIKGIPSAARELIKPYEKVAKRASYGLTAITGLWDTAHIWTANNGLTKNQRLARTALKGVGIAAGIALGGLSAPIFATGLALGFTAAGISYLAAGCIVSYGIGTGLELGEKYVSGKLGLGNE